MKNEIDLSSTFYVIKYMTIFHIPNWKDGIIEIENLKQVYENNYFDEYNQFYYIYEILIKSLQHKIFVTHDISKENLISLYKKAQEEKSCLNVYTSIEVIKDLIDTKQMDEEPFSQILFFYPLEGNNEL